MLKTAERRSELAIRGTRTAIIFQCFIIFAKKQFFQVIAIRIRVSCVEWGVELSASRYLSYYTKKILQNYKKIKVGVSYYRT